MTDDQRRVHHLDIARNHDVAGGDGRGTGRRKLEPLRALAFHLERDLLDVEDDVGHVLAHAGEAREFVQDIIDLDRRERRSEEHTSEIPSLMSISKAVFCLKKKKLK